MFTLWERVGCAVGSSGCGGWSTDAPAAHRSCTDHRSVPAQVLAGLVAPAARDHSPTSGIWACWGICEICSGNQGSKHLKLGFFNHRCCSLEIIS